MTNKQIRVAILGVGNCASALVQGVDKYSKPEYDHAQIQGLMQTEIGGYRPKDISFVAAFDVDGRKVYKRLREAIRQLPNNCFEIDSGDDGDLFEWSDGSNPYVRLVPRFDGVADHMFTKDIEDPERFYIDDVFDVDNNYAYSKDCQSHYVDVLKELEVDVLLNYLPVGSEYASKWWAEVCLTAKVNMVNCIPVFIASDKVWAQKFVDAGVTIIGDDMRSMVGASIISAALHELFLARGASIDVHYQDNIGGNTDFLNMQDQTRLASKKISKENVIRNQNKLAGVATKENSIAAGPAKYFPALGDNKRASWLIKGTIFGGAPFEFTADLSCQDSPNSAGVVIDALRLVKVANEMGIVGPLIGPSAYTQKTPPVDMSVNDAAHECKELAQRIVPNGYQDKNRNVNDPKYVHVWVNEQ